MTNNLIEWLKQVTPVIPIIGIGLSMIFQGLTWYSNDKKLDGTWALSCGVVVFLAGLLSLLFTYVSWVRQIAPSITIWAICLLLLFQGSKLVGKSNRNWIGWLAISLGILLFLVGVLVYSAISGNTWWSTLLWGLIPPAIILSGFTILEWRLKKR